MYAAASTRRRNPCADINEPLGSRQQGLELSRDEPNHPRRRRFGDPSRSSRETPFQVQPSTPREEKREVLRGVPTAGGTFFASNKVAIPFYLFKCFFDDNR